MTESDDSRPFSRGVDELATLLGLRASGTDAVERERARSRLLNPYLRALEAEGNRSTRAEYVRHLLAVDAITAIGDATLERMAELTRSAGDVDLAEAVLTRVVESNAERGMKIRAHEALAEIFEHEGNVEKAGGAFKAAARLREDAGDSEQARRLYERALDRNPSDAGAAERLVAIHVRDGAWKKVPEFMGALLRADEDRGAEILLGLQERAREANALAFFVDVVDEALALRPPTSDLTHELRRAHARSLASDRSLEERASASYRTLVEAFADDADAREYIAFLIAAKDTPQIHADLCWVFEWRKERTELDAASLLAWAKAEEARGALDAAIAVHKEALEVAGGDRSVSWLALYELYEKQGKREEALEALAHLLAIEPPIERAHAAARKHLIVPEAGNTTALTLERIADGLDDVTAAAVFAFLLASRAETKHLLAARRRWHRRLGELRAGRIDLNALLADAADMPEEVGLWDAAEAVARAHGKLEVVVRAYANVIRGGGIAPALAEQLGKRASVLEGEAQIDPSVLIDVVEAVLAVVPASRWALDRAKVVLGASGNWDTLLTHYDRALDTAVDDRERAELLDEAAFAARDAADDPDRAIGYLERLRALLAKRADVDRENASRAERIALALERLYERRGRTVDLAGMLEQRLPSTSGRTRRDLLRRIAQLRLDTQNPEAARVALDAMRADGASASELLDLLERLAGHPSQQLARTELAAHYEAAGQLDDVVRIRLAALTHTNLREERRQAMRDLVRARLAATKGATGAFARVAESIAKDAGDDARIAKAAHRVLLMHAIAALRAAPTDAVFEEAAEAAQRAIAALKDLFQAEGDWLAAARLLERGGRLRIDRRRQRGLLYQAALLWSGRLGDARRATRLFTEIFQDDVDDPVAQSAFDHLRAHYETTRADEKLALLWEERGTRAERAGNEATAGDSFVNAGAIWERLGDHARAVTAYTRSAKRDVHRAYEALARIHAAQQEWPETIAALEWLHAHAPAEERQATSLRLARAHFATGKQSETRTYLEAALANASTEERGELRRELIELDRQEGRWESVADLLEAEGSFREAAEIRRSKLHDVPGAVRLLERVIAADPQDAVTRPELAELLEELEAWDRVVEVLEQHVALHGDRGPTEAAAIRYRLARALVRLGRQKDAVEALQIAAKLQPANTDILRELGHLASETGDLEVAERAYRALLLTVRRDRTARNDVYLDLAALAVRRGDEPRAENLLESALESAFEDGEVPATLEKALLERKCHALVARALEWRLARAPTLDERVRTLMDLTQTWQANLATEPELGQRMAGLLDACIHELPAGLERATLRTALAGIFSETPGQADAAITQLSGALEDDPMATKALDLLEYILERDDRQAEAADRLAAHLARIPKDKPEWSSAAWRLGRALERANRLDDARVLYESILDSLDARPTSLDDIRMLASRLDASGSERLADCLERAIAVDPSALPDLLPRLIELRDWQRDDDALERAFDLGLDADPTSTKYCTELVRLYEKRDDWAAAARVLNRTLVATNDDRAILKKLCEVNRKMGAEASSLPILDRVIDVDRGDSELHLLRAIARASTGDDRGAVTDLAHVDASESSIALLETIVGRASPDVVDAYAMTLVVKLLAIKRSEAKRVLLSILERAPDHLEALEKLGSISVAASDWPAARDAYRRLVDLDQARGDAAVEVVTAFAEACERAGTPGEALKAIERALVSVPDDVELARRLERICEAQGDWARVVDLMTARARQATDDKEMSALLLRASQIYEKELASPAEALRQAERARMADPEAVEPALACGRLYTILERPEKALAVLEPLVAGSRAKRAALLARAHLYTAQAHLQLDALAEAFDALKAAFSADIRSREIALLLGLVAIDLGEEVTAERALLAVASLRSKDTEADADAVADQRTAYRHLAALASARGEEAKAQRWRSKAEGNAPAGMSIPPTPPSSDRVLPTS